MVDSFLQILPQRKPGSLHGVFGREVRYNDNNNNNAFPPF